MSYAPSQLASFPRGPHTDRLVAPSLFRPRPVATDPDATPKLASFPQVAYGSSLVQPSAARPRHAAYSQDSAAAKLASFRTPVPPDSPTQTHQIVQCTNSATNPLTLFLS